jgi:dCTP deaminase
MDGVVGMLLNDTQIMSRCLNEGMINPFVGKQVKRNAISYGVSSFGYDIRLGGGDFRVFKHIPGRVVDPKRFDESFLVSQELINGSAFVIPANSYALGVSLEEFRMPDDVLAICLGKSTYARSGLIVNVTPAEPGWKGYLTIEISNSSSADVLVYAYEGIAQMLFLQGERPHTTYSDRAGKYQSQPEQVVTSKL